LNPKDNLKASNVEDFCRLIETFYLKTTKQEKEKSTRVSIKTLQLGVS